MTLLWYSAAAPPIAVRYTAPPLRIAFLHFGVAHALADHDFKSVRYKRRRVCVHASACRRSATSDNAPFDCRRRSAVIYCGIVKVEREFFAVFDRRANTLVRLISRRIYYAVYGYRIADLKRRERRPIGGASRVLLSFRQSQFHRPVS